MTSRLTWICHGATPANRAGLFPADEALEPQAAEKAKRLAGRLASVDRVWTSPALRARQTAEALCLDGPVQEALRECDYGRWRGRSLADVGGAEPDGLLAWMTDAEAAPHGGEPLARLLDRVAAWTEAQRPVPGHTVVVTHASVIRAAMLHVLGAPPQSFWKIDIEPLGMVAFGGDGRRWTLRIAGRRDRDSP